MAQSRVYTESRIYHTIVRCNGRLFLMDSQEAKEMFVRKIWQYADFCNVSVLSFAVLDNHAHVLVQVNRRYELSDEELLQKLTVIYPQAYVDEVCEELEKCLSDKDDLGANAVRQRYLRRMFSLSHFMKELKQSYSIWYNRNHDRKGTLWEERFRSVAVEDSEGAILAMAGYIDLNAVRAGIVKDPKDHRFSCYGASMGGDTRAQRALKRVFRLATGQEVLSKSGKEQWKHVSSWYRALLFDKGREVRSDDGKVIRKGLQSKDIEKVLASEGKLSLAEILRCRVRYFVDGAAIGSESFMKEIIEGNSESFSPDRKSLGRKLREGPWKDLWSVRGLQSKVISVRS